MALEHLTDRPVDESTAPVSPKGVQFPDLDWFLANFQAIVASYPDEWLAIADQKVVAHATTPDELRRQIKHLGIQRPLIVRSHPDAWASVK
jgi:uncharacterized protein DUF5678